MDNFRRKTHIFFPKKPNSPKNHPYFCLIVFSVEKKHPRVSGPTNKTCSRSWFPVMRLLENRLNVGNWTPWILQKKCHLSLPIPLMVQKSSDHQLRSVFYPTRKRRVVYIPGGCFGCLNHQQYHPWDRYMYPHLAYFYSKCRNRYHIWIVGLFGLRN